MNIEKWIHPGDVMYVNVDSPADVYDAESYEYLNESHEAEHLMEYWDWLGCLVREDLPSTWEIEQMTEAEKKFWSMSVCNWFDHIKE